MKTSITYLYYFHFFPRSLLVLPVSREGASEEMWRGGALRERGGSERIKHQGNLRARGLHKIPL